MILHCLKCNGVFQGDGGDGFCFGCRAKLPGVAEVKAQPATLNTECESCHQLFEIPRDCPACSRD
jgi:hypothetical protein